MLTLVLAEAELELVPGSIKAHTSVRASAGRRDRRPSRTLLDSSLHHDALQNVTEGDRRGRPDLTHFFLLLGLDSVLNQRRGLTLLVHTRNDELIRIDPETRIMRNYNRFVGLIESLFREKAVPKGKNLLTLEEGWTLERVLRDAVPAGVHKAVLKEGAPKRVTPHEWLAERAAASSDLCVVIGGFPKGDYHADVDALADDVVGFGDEALTVWTVEMELIAHWEAVTGAFLADAPPHGSLTRTS